MAFKTSKAARVGVDSTDSVFVMENHDEAYRIWRRAGVKNRVLVHIDAHHDLWWIDEGAPVTIANFICPAIRSDLIGEVMWVVPNATWESAESRAAAITHVRKIEEKYSGTPGATLGRNAISTQLLGKRLTVCSLKSLPSIEDAVLLDIDVDFLVIPRVTFGRHHEDQQALPWCWPEALVSALRRIDIRSDLVTIAYSVDGGYTPMKWKYLGDELSLRLRGCGEEDPAVAGMSLLGSGAAHAAHDVAAAEHLYVQACRLLPAAAAPLFHLALLYARAGRAADARARYQQAVTLDPSYRSAFNSAGFPYFWDGRLREAGNEFQRALDLDPDDAHAHLGVGLIVMQGGHWPRAEASLRRALSRDGDLLDAHRALAELFDRQGRRDEATAANEAAMRLALAGTRSLRAPVLTGEIDEGGGARTYEDLAGEYLERALLRVLEGRRQGGS